MSVPPESRRRRRRVPDDLRQRAPRSCVRCKRRKNRCVETESGSCQRCLAGAFICRFERELSPADRPDRISGEEPEFSLPLSSIDHAGSNLRDDGATTTESNLDFNVPTSGSDNHLWRGFLHRLREAFFLDPQDTSKHQTINRVTADNGQTSPARGEEQERCMEALRALPPYNVARFLVTVCITHGTDSFFYFDQQQFLRELDQLYNQPSSHLRFDTSFVCLVLAIMALGSQWTGLEKTKGRQTSPAPENSDPGRVFYRHARVLIPDLIERSCVRSVMALFIMGVYLMPATAISACYIIMGIALRKAVAQGLHQYSDDPSLSEYTKEVRRRLWWSLYSLERTTTIKLNRPRSLDPSLITTPLPKPLPELDSQQKFDNVRYQIANARLVGILDRGSDLGTWSKDKAQRFEAYEADLAQWKRQLPFALKLDHIDAKSSQFRVIAHLYLNYHFGRIMTGKLAVVAVVRSRLRTTLTHEDEPSPPDAPIVTLASACIRASRKILQLFEHLCSTGNITHFSFTDFQGCSIATIIALLAGILRRDAGYATMISIGLDCLRRMAGSDVRVQNGVHFVESAQAVADEAYRKLQSLHQSDVFASDADHDPSATHEHSDYDIWSQWLASKDADCISESTRVVQPSTPTPSTHTDLPAPMETHRVRRQQVPGSIRHEYSSYRVTPDVRDPLPSLLTDPGIPAQQATGQVNGSPQSPRRPASSPTHGYVWDHQPDPASARLDNPFALYNDDQDYLMDLTGLDVLDFSGLG